MIIYCKEEEWVDVASKNQCVLKEQNGILGYYAAGGGSHNQVCYVEVAPDKVGKKEWESVGKVIVSTQEEADDLLKNTNHHI